MKRKIVLFFRKTWWYGDNDFWASINFEKIKKLLYIPYGMPEEDWESCVESVRNLPSSRDIDVSSPHQTGNKITGKFDAIFVADGNMFRLLANLQRFEMLSDIRKMVLEDGVKYIGVNSGSILASPSIATTNDIPIIFPHQGFKALNLVSFHTFIMATVNGNMDYENCRDFDEVSDLPLIGLRDSSFLQINEEYFERQDIFVGGTHGGYIIKKGEIDRNVYQRTVSLKPVLREV